MGVTLEIQGLDKFFSQAQKLPDVIQGGVKVAGRSVTRALVWEWGRITCKPGPKTMYSTNPNGETRVLTITAPHGWIRVNRNKYEEALKKEVAQVKWGDFKIAQWPAQIKKLLKRTGKTCIEIMRETAPEDTGQLKSDLSVVDPDDPMLGTSGGELDLGNF